MGLFSFGRTDVKQSWLDRADAAYSKALIYGKASAFDAFGTVDFCCTLANRIAGGSKIFAGTEKYKKVEWHLKSKDAATRRKVYIKNVTYDQLKYARDVYVSIDDAYSEEWTVIYGDKPLVENIQRC